ncbi:MAG: hypothetical protein OXI77_07005 [Chloroflexota bacterium]|nr:hypothetical protein [Chloroflexota bacterium]MDE2910263.1 hypothetical protein [Chloroflexota bacterium]
MVRLLLSVVAATLLGALIGAIGVYVLAEGLPEGAIMGGSVGALIAVRRHYGASGPALELEAAGIHNDNLTTTARHNLMREPYRDSISQQIFEEKIEGLGSANRPKRR